MLTYLNAYHIKEKQGDYLASDVPRYEFRLRHESSNITPALEVMPNIRVRLLSCKRIKNFLLRVSQMSQLSHFDDQGRSRMVDTTAKAETERYARASALVRMLPDTIALILDRALAKGDVREVARLAGIMAAKKTSDLIPLCHPLALTGVSVELAFDRDCLRIEAEVRVFGKTGVEMEALTAVSIAALTVYDMVKSVDRGVTIERIRLEEKTGGKSGTFQRDEDDPIDTTQKEPK